MCCVGAHYQQCHHQVGHVVISPDNVAWGRYRVKQSQHSTLANESVHENGNHLKRSNLSPSSEQHASSPFEEAAQILYFSHSNYGQVSVKSDLLKFLHMPLDPSTTCAYAPCIHDGISRVSSVF